MCSARMVSPNPSAMVKKSLALWIWGLGYILTTSLRITNRSFDQPLLTSYTYLSIKYQSQISIPSQV